MAKKKQPQKGSKKPAVPKAAAPKASASPPPVKKPLARLEKWLAAHRKHYLAGLRSGASEKELHAMQAQLGVEVPEDLRALLAWHNGQSEEFIGKFEQDWILLGTDRIPDAYRDLLAGAVGNGAGNGFQPGWIPFLDDGGNYVCVDANEPPGPVRAFWLGNKDHPVIAPSLGAWLAEFVAALEAGEYHEEPERGTLLRKTSAHD